PRSKSPSHTPSGPPLRNNDTTLGAQGFEASRKPSAKNPSGTPEILGAQGLSPCNGKKSETAHVRGRRRPKKASRRSNAYDPTAREEPPICPECGQEGCPGNCPEGQRAAFERDEAARDEPWGDDEEPEEPWWDAVDDDPPPTLH